MQKIKFVLVAVAFFSPAVVMPAAHAAITYAYHPSDPSYAGVRDHVWIWACDNHVDGNRVRAWYDYVYAPTSYYYTAWAPSQSCTEPIRGIANFRSFRICVENEGCGSWYWA